MDKCYDEFDDGRPPALKILLVNDKGQLEWAALLISQLPNASSVLPHWNAVSSGVPIDDVFFGLCRLPLGLMFCGGSPTPGTT